MPGLFTLSALALAVVVLFPTLSKDARAETPGGEPDSPLADQALGKRFSIKPDSLPEPNQTQDVRNAPLTIPFKDQRPKAPEGFTVTPFATGLANPRRLLVLPNGDVVVAEQKPGYLTLLRDGDGDGKAEWVERHAEGFDQPYGLAWRDGEILVADQSGIWSVPHTLEALRAGHGEQKDISEVPPDQRVPEPNGSGKKLITKKEAFGLVSGHRNRHLVIDPKTGALFVGVGSAGNIGEEPEVKASIQRFNADGGGQETFASGVRNPTGLAFHPDTNELYAVVQERDGLGDKLVPDYLARIEKGAFYGWPYAYIGSHPQPGFAEKAPDKVQASVTPDLLFESHSSAMDIVFYQGEQYPDDYKGSAFVALKGSWNRTDPTGYKVVRVPFENGKPADFYENFLTGFWVSGDKRAEVWGRPAALAVTEDGALLVADDTAGTLWRIGYDRQGRPPERQSLKSE